MHSLVLVVLYLELVVYCGCPVVSVLQALSIRHPSVAPSYMAQRGCAISKEQFSQLVQEVEDLRHSTQGLQIRLGNIFVQVIFNLEIFIQHVSHSNSYRMNMEQLEFNWKTSWLTHPDSSFSQVSSYAFACSDAASSPQINFKLLDLNSPI
jgi:hypothetical protein